MAVVFLDLDLFESLNDTFGHTGADGVLVEVARRLSATLRGQDTLARFAGDEFVIICKGLPPGPPEVLVKRVAAVTERLQQALHAPIRIAHRTHAVMSDWFRAHGQDPVTQDG